MRKSFFVVEVNVEGMWLDLRGPYGRLEFDDEFEARTAASIECASRDYANPTRVAKVESLEEREVVSVS